MKKEIRKTIRFNSDEFNKIENEYKKHLLALESELHRLSDQS